MSPSVLGSWQVIRMSLAHLTPGLFSPHVFLPKQNYDPENVPFVLSEST